MVDLFEGMSILNRIVKLRSRIKAMGATRCPRCGTEIEMPTDLMEKHGLEAFNRMMDIAEAFVADLERQRGQS